MSLQFSNTTTKAGIIQLIERNCGFNEAEISGNSTLLAQFTGDVNLALDRALSLIFNAGRTWQFDDSNHTDYPIITTNIVSGQRDYSFTTDGNSNLILDIYKIVVADSSGKYQEVTPVDVQTDKDVNSFFDGSNTTGKPTRYDKTANGIFLDPVPNYNYTNGLKIYINREGSYFTTSDTTKKPGIAGLFHQYFALYPSYLYSYRNGLTNADRLEREVFKIEDEMVKYYGLREKDVKRRILPNIENCR